MIIVKKYSCYYSTRDAFIALDKNKLSLAVIVFFCFVLRLVPAAALTYHDCVSPEDEQTMGQCAYRDFRGVEDKLAHENQKVDQRLKKFRSAQRIFKLDKQDWLNYMILECSNKVMGIEDVEDGSDSNSRAFCKIQLMLNRIKILNSIR